MNTYTRYNHCNETCGFLGFSWIIFAVISFLSTFNILLKTNSLTTQFTIGLIDKFSSELISIIQPSNRVVPEYCANLNHSSSSTLCWKCPPEGWVKLNIDGSVIQGGSKSSIGGVIRDANGVWIADFAGQVGNFPILTTEILAIRRGLVLAWSFRFECIEVETDSLQAVDLLDRADSEFHALGGIIEDCRLMMRKPWNCTLKHIKRDGNSAADFLAKWGHDNGDPSVVFEDPPVGVLNLLYEDCVTAFGPLL